MYILWSVKGIVRAHPCTDIWPAKPEIAPTAQDGKGIAVVSSSAAFLVNPTHTDLQPLRELLRSEDIARLDSTEFGSWLHGSPLAGSISSGRNTAHFVNSDSRATVTRSAKTCSNVPGPAGVLTFLPINGNSRVWGCPNFRSASDGAPGAPAGLSCGAAFGAL